MCGSERSTISRRQWIFGLAACGLLTAMPEAKAAPANDNRSPEALDQDWRTATRRYRPERARRVAEAKKGAADGPFRPDWASLQKYQVPKWYADAKFGIFVHWGVFSVPAFGSEWYSRNMYVKGSKEYLHHIKTYGPQARFGYKDFIPRFKAENFHAKDWAALFRAAGARYVVPVAEHHDGFALYDSALSDYTAVKLGPKRDLLGEISRAVRAKGLHFALSNHRAEHDWFFGVGNHIPSDVRDPKNAGLYGPAQDHLSYHGDDADLFRDYTHVSQDWLDDWLARQVELVDRYHPELVYFDWWIGHPSFRTTLPKFLAWYYNYAAKTHSSAVVNYKLGEMADGAAVLDIERGEAPGIRKDVWQTCTSISNKSWGYIAHDSYKSPAQLIHLLVDIVSKNGNLLLNVGPRADGTIPDAARDTLLAMGRWLKVNGEAIYGARPWVTFGEGPTETASGSFTESKAKPYTEKDFRFTVRDDRLYAIELSRPHSGRITIHSIRSDYPVKHVTLLGTDAPVHFRQSPEGLALTLPQGLSDQPAYVWRIETRS